jgi:hypothetical protein
MRVKPTITVLVIAAAGCAGNKLSDTRGTAASSAPLSPAVTFQQADLDGDARITPREYQAWLSKSGEGAVTAAAGGTVGGGEDRVFYAADRNLNGVLTLDEWLAMPSRASMIPPSR